MQVATACHFDDPAVVAFLDKATAEEIDSLAFGVIGFDAETLVRVYGAWESRHAGLAQSSIVDRPMFTHVAQCMNNYLVAERFADALASATPLDETIAYVLTLRMRPTRVRLRLLSEPGMRLRYLLVDRTA